MSNFTNYLKISILITVFYHCFFAISCSSDTVNTEKYQIISLLLEEFGFYFPPPPPGGTYSYNKFQIDSIKKTPKKIAIFPYLRIFNEKLEPNFFEGKLEYFKLYEKLTKIQKEDISLDRIENSFNHYLFFLDENETMNDFNCEDPDVIMFFDQIVFDHKKEKALTALGRRSHYLNSNGILILLEKINGEWQIVETKLLEIS